ncbi:hypothetical protein [Streptomyces sp. NPDC002779]|uniref:hypothetical protein n=1 Tax=Streptomyces sp. NPDC002779 TaxID=3364664 RepID=UPI00369622B1
MVGPDGLVIRPARNECTAQSATTVQCVYTFPLSPDGTDVQDLRNSSAGAWRFRAKAVAEDEDSHHLSPGAPLGVERHTKLESAQATPEPVDKGGKPTAAHHGHREHHRHLAPAVHRQPGRDGCDVAGRPGGGA